MRIAAYCRVSTEKEEQLDSLSQQKSFFGEYAAKHNYNLTKIYPDEGLSGKQLKKRDEFNKMMRDARLGLFETVVVKDISRFARNTVDFLTSIRQLKMWGIGVQFISNNMTSLGDSEFVLTIFAALAQEESAGLSKRIKFGKNINAQKGKVPNIVFGYDQVDKFTLTINEAEAAVVRKIFRMYLEDGIGAKKIAILMDKTATVPLKKGGKRWEQNTVMRMLKNEIYTGVITNKKSEVIDFITGTRREFDESQWLKTERPELMIVSKEKFNKVQELLKGRHALFSRNKERQSNLFIFSTLIKCDHCGFSFRRYYKELKHGPYRKWTCCGRHRGLCDSKIYVDEFELIDSIKNYLHNIVADKNAFIKNARAQFDGLNLDDVIESVDPDKLQKELDRLTKAKKKVTTMFENDVLTIDELKERTAELNTEIAAIKDKLQNIEEKITEQKYTKQDQEISLNKVFDTMENIITDNNFSNELLKNIFEKIVVNKDGEVKIHIKHFTSQTV